jgi:hypothetical protein
VTGPAPLVAAAAYAALMWAIALALDHIGRRALRARRSTAAGDSLGDAGMGSDVARFHRGIGGALLGVGAFLLVSLALARRDPAALLLLPLAAACLSGALRRVRPLWREP